MSSFAAFFQSVLRDPARAGAVAPSSAALSARMASLVRRDGSPVIEIGAGTGAFTRAMLERGIAADRLWSVEMDTELAIGLEEQFPGVHVVRGNAAELPQLLPEFLQGSVGTVVSGLPMRSLPERERRAAVESAVKMLARGGEFLQFTYGFRSPIATEGLPLKAERLGRIWKNLPPAEVWRYRKQ